MASYARVNSGTYLTFISYQYCAGEKEKMRQGRESKFYMAKIQTGQHLPVNIAGQPPSFNAPHHWLLANKWQTVSPFQRH